MLGSFQFVGIEDGILWDPRLVKSCPEASIKLIREGAPECAQEFATSGDFLPAGSFVHRGLVVLCNFSMHVIAPNDVLGLGDEAFPATPWVHRRTARTDPDQQPGA